MPDRTSEDVPGRMPEYTLSEDMPHRMSEGIGMLNMLMSEHTSRRMPESHVRRPVRWDARRDSIAMVSTVRRMVRKILTSCSFGHLFGVISDPELH